MSKAEQEKRKAKFEEVLSILISRPQFGREEIVSQCREAKTHFVNNVLKQLAADSLLGLVLSEESGGDQTLRYAWLVDRVDFDPQAWIQQQLSGGHQVSSAPKEERPRERLLELGADKLTNSELLAILIRSGRKGESAIQSGQRVARQFEERLEQLPTQSPAEMKEISSAVSSVAYCQIMAGIELGRRVADASQTNAPKLRINSTKAAIEYCLRHFARLARDARHEEFHIVTLDTKLQPIQSHQITVGTLDASLVHPREVFKAAIRDSAASILLVHNHPSGDPSPSRQDHEVTERLKSVGEIVGIQVLDHIVVAKDQAVSLAECS